MDPNCGHEMHFRPVNRLVNYHSPSSSGHHTPMVSADGRVMFYPAHDYVVYNVRPNTPLEVNSVRNVADERGKRVHERSSADQTNSIASTRVQNHITTVKASVTVQVKEKKVRK